ncbi:MAG: response regulator transcription factor [Blastocatellia bacterium]|nr:response regulator transcription factor [Blastocatellia bacterium]
MSEETTQPIHILTVDDHPVARAWLEIVISRQEGMEIVGEADNGKEAIELAERLQPDVIMLDIDLGSESGLDLLPELRAAAAGARVLMLTGLRDPEAHRQAVRLGAMGVVLKEKSDQAIISAILSAHSGEVWIDRSLMESLLADD